MKLLFVPLLMISTTIYAEIINEKGNGGDAVVCRDATGRILRADLLDHYEGKAIRNLHPVTQSLGGEEKFLNQLGKKLAKYDKGAFHDFSAEATKLFQALENYRAGGPSHFNQVAFTHEELIDIPDAGDLLLKPGCKIEQLAIRLKPRFPEDPSYIIQADILKSLSENDVLGLAVHEAVYRAFVQTYKAKDSVVSRYLTQLITSRQLTELSFQHWLEAYYQQMLMVPGSEGRFVLQVGGLKFNTHSKVQLTNGSTLMEQVTDFNSSNQVMLVINKNGEVDLELSRKHGKIGVTPWTSSKAPKMLIKEINASVRGKKYNLDFDKPYERWVYLDFGTLQINVSVSRLRDFDDPQPFDVGAKLGGTVKGERYAFIRQIMAGKETQTHSRRFEIGLNPDFSVAIKELR